VAAERISYGVLVGALEVAIGSLWVVLGQDRLLRLGYKIHVPG